MAARYLFNQHTLTNISILIVLCFVYTPFRGNVTGY